MAFAATATATKHGRNFFEPRVWRGTKVNEPAHVWGGWEFYKVSWEWVAGIAFLSNAYQLFARLRIGNIEFLCDDDGCRHMPSRKMRCAYADA